ncbi:hypothetical protein GGF32_003944 [Allomyces javanicus]|nr:hypothetical protein GGF32_003944 [Allomyces javanicus]
MSATTSAPAAPAPAPAPAPVRGSNVSRRPWKEPKTKVSTMRPATLKKPFAKRMEERKIADAIKRHEKELKDEKLRAIEEQKERRKEQELRRKQNELKSQVVQSVSSRKVKRMSKKQLRASGIEMRPSASIIPVGSMAPLTAEDA